MATNIHHQSLPVRAHGILTHVASHLQSAVLLILRITWGWQLLQSGYGHLTHVEKTVKAFQSWGVPAPHLNVYISGTTELVGGLLLVIGLAARLISVPLVFNFLVAYATASRDTLKQLAFGPQRLDGYDAFINDSAFPMLVLALTILAFGPGKASVDYLLQRTLFRKHIAVPGDPTLRGADVRTETGEARPRVVS